MRLGLRTRLFLSVVVLVGVFAATSGAWLSGQLRELLVHQEETYLLSHARTLAHVLPGAGSEHALVERFARTSAARITLIELDGGVRADSEADAAQMDNHASRPEVVEALAEGFGTSVRQSATTDRQMLYVAVPWPESQPTQIIRVARPLTEVSANVDRLSRGLWFGAVGSLLLTIVMAAAFSQVVTRDLRELTARARGLARSTSGPGDEIAWISGSIDRLSGELASALDDVADERNRMEAVLAGMAEAVVAVDRNGRVELTNPSARELLGLRSSTMGLPLVQALGSPVLVEVVRAVLESGQSQSRDVSWASSVDPATRLDLKATVTPQAGGGAVLVVHDRTELNRLEAIRRDFVANVSHELRTPIAVIQSSSEALLEGAVDDQTHGPRFAEAIARHAERLGNLITDLLDLAKVESGRQPIHLEPLDVRECAADAIDGLLWRAEEAGQQLEVDVDDGLTVLGDERALHQILVNLIDNAIKYSGAGTTIGVQAEAFEDHVELVVVDDGPGISDQHHSRVFERFYRVDPGRSRDMGGTGLGLAIVRHLVQVQGGSIRLEHNAPRGARFVITLPRGQNSAASQAAL